MAARNIGGKEEHVIERKGRQILHGFGGIPHHRNDALAYAIRLWIGNAGQIQDRRQEIEMVIERGRLFGGPGRASGCGR